ncbi:MAG: ABC transporter permease [Puia sp.]|nr:ABC transporter permease [Puia sp.]
MLRNFLLVIFRGLSGNKVYAFINIAGLALGMAAFMLIRSYIHFEQSYDRVSRGEGSCYRVESQFYRGDQLTDSWATSTNGYARAMKDHFPEISSFARINWNNSERIVRYGDIKYREEHVCFADSNFFDFFDYPLIKGDPKTVLKDVNTVVISESAARKYFRGTDPVGKFLDITTLSDSYHCMVSGVCKDIPHNSTLQFNFLISWSTTPEWQKNFWYIHDSYTYVKLRPGARPAEVEAKFPALAELYKTEAALKELKWTIRLIPLADIHLNAAKPYEKETKGNRRAVGFLGIMAFVILSIAWVNYINLSTAKAVSRAKEVGIRKVSGALRGQLLAQFLLESFIINGLALIVAVFLTAVATWSVPRILGEGMSYGFLFDKGLISWFAIVFISGVFLSGIYPAIVLTRLQPIKVLKGKYSFSRAGVFLRQSLVGLQFTLSLVLIAGTIGVYRQVVYMSSQDLGVNIDRFLVIKAPVNTSGYREKTEHLKAALRSVPGVIGVTGSGAVPGKEVGEFLANRRVDANKQEERPYEMLKVDFDFIGIYGLTVIAGRSFDPGRPSDSTGVVLNESAVRQFGYFSPEDAIGKKVLLEANHGHANEIIGVLKDYHQQSLQQQFTPIVLFMDPDYPWIPTDYYSVKINTDQVQAIVEKIQRIWGGLFAESSFDFFFLDDFFNRQYRQDRQFGSLFGLFSSLAILIACMGLFGLTAYSTARRSREIGIRKTLGASVGSVLRLLLWDSVKLILYASFVAIPVSFLVLSRWLQAYAFRVGLTWWQFLLPLFILSLIAVATVGLLSIRAAMSKPSLTLREE